MDWNSYFAMLEDWKRLPAYRAEPRIDSLIGYYLPEMATDFCREKIVGIIPELPLRLGTVRPNLNDKLYADKSYKVDFYLLGETGTNYFVEFKTDSGSRRDKQDDYLLAAQTVKMPAVIQGIQRIAFVSTYKKKYGHLLAKLQAHGLIDQQGHFTGTSDKIDIVYAQPHKKDGDEARKVIDFAWLSDWLTKRFGQSDFEAALARSLLKWASD